MYFNTIKKWLKVALKNRTDGFMATVLVPSELRLPAYMVFNCYGMDEPLSPVPKKHRKMIVEVINKSRKDPCHKQFNWDFLIPVEVSDSPKVLLKGKKLKNALTQFNQQEWDEIYKFIKCNQLVIHRHWINETDSPSLMRELKTSDGELLFYTDDDGLLRHGIHQINTGNTHEFSYLKLLNMYKARVLKTNDKGELIYTYSEDNDMKGTTVVCVDSDGKPFFESYFV